MRVAIVGAGMAGLSCAYELQKRGAEVTVYEKEAQAGGRASTKQTMYQPLDLGAQFLSSTYKEAQELCKELGIAPKWAPFTPHTHHIYFRGQLHCASYSSPWDLLKLGYLSTWSRMRFFFFLWQLVKLSEETSFYLLKADSSLDTTTVYDFAVKWAGKETADRVVEAFVAGYHFHSADQLSLAFFAAMAGVWKTKFTYDTTQEGIDQLAQALAKKLNVRFNSPVDSVEGTQITVDRQIDRFDAVVIATTAPIALQLLPRQSPVRSFLEKVEYASTLHAAYVCPADPVRHLAMGVVSRGEGSAVAGFMNQSAKYPNHSHAQSLMSVFLREEEAREWMNRSDADCFAYMKEQLLNVCPPLKGQELIPCNLQRWPQAMPKYSPGSLQRVAHFLQHEQGKKGLFLAGDYLNAPWIEGSIRLGKKVAQEVLQEEP